MIDVICPKCNKTLMVYSEDFVWDEDFCAKSLCCDEVFWISHETLENNLERKFHLYEQHNV